MSRSKWKRWPSGSSPRPRTSTRAARPSWKSESRSSRASEFAVCAIAHNLESLGDDILLGKRLDLPRRVSEGPQDRLGVLAFRRDTRGISRLRRRVFRGVGDDLELPDPRHVDRREQATGFHLWVTDDVGHPLHSGDREPFREEERLLLSERPFSESGGERLRDRGPLGRFGELLSRQLRRPDEFAHPLPELRFHRRDREPLAVLRLVEAVERERSGQEGFAGHRFFARRQIPRKTEDQQGHGGVVDRDIDEFAAARAVSSPERCEEAQRRIESAREVGDRHARDRGSPSVEAPGDGQQAGERLEVDVVPREIFVRPILAVSREGAVDQLRIPHREGIVVRAQTSHDAGPELLHDDVRAACEFSEDFLPLDGLQVDRERTLPAVHHREGIRDLVDEWRHRSHVVAELRVLDLDDVRAEVAQELRAERPREEAREIQDRDALEGRRHGGSKSRSRYQSSCTADLPVAVLRCIRNPRWRGAGDWLKSKQSAMSSALASRWRNVERPKFTSQNFNRLTCEWKMNRSPGHVPPDTAGSDRRPSNLIPLSRLRNHGVENLLIPRGSWSRRS